jgi:phosphoadenosine phosphosulfate reductase
MRSPDELVRSVLEPADHTACLTCSFQAEDMVVLDLARKVRPAVPVLFLDTGYHFPETYAYRDKMTELWQLNLVNLLPERSVAAQEAQFGKLYVIEPSRCCGLRKVEPLQRALEQYDVWLTGLRREQSPSRASLEEIETQRLPSGHQIRKITPLAHWTTEDVWTYVRVHQIETLSLYDEGYTSIGCQPCTSLPSDPSNPRSGRWGGTKLECGIHTFAGQR